jgi:hypothetical protein
MLYSEYLLLKVLLILITIYEGPFVFCIFFSMKKSPYVELFFFFFGIFFFLFFQQKNWERFGKKISVKI